MYRPKREHWFQVIRQTCSEWLVVASIALMMVSGSVADERAFSAMNFIKNVLRNRLHVNLEACVMMYAQDMLTTASFPYEELDKALAAKCKL